MEENTRDGTKLVLCSDRTSNGVVHRSSSEETNSNARPYSTSVHLGGEDPQSGASAFKRIMSSSSSAANIENSVITLRQRSSSSLQNASTNGSRFSRDSHRLSMQIIGDGPSKWENAADR